MTFTGTSLEASHSLAVTEAKLGPEHPDMASVLSACVLLLWEMERYDEADELDDADTADIFTEISRGIDKWLWFVEAHSQADK